MQADVWYELTLRALSGESAAAELLRDAETAQAAAPVEESDPDDSGAMAASPR